MQTQINNIPKLILNASPVEAPPVEDLKKEAESKTNESNVVSDAGPIQSIGMQESKEENREQGQNNIPEEESAQIQSQLRNLIAKLSPKKSRFSFFNKKKHNSKTAALLKLLETIPEIKGNQAPLSDELLINTFKKLLWVSLQRRKNSIFSPLSLLKTTSSGVVIKGLLNLKKYKELKTFLQGHFSALKNQETIRYRDLRACLTGKVTERNDFFNLRHIKGRESDYFLSIDSLSEEMEMKKRMKANRA